MKPEQARTAAYFDSSVLLKRYVRETGSDQAVDFMRSYLIISSAIAPLEMRSALRRLHAESGLSARAFQATLARIQSERRKWDLVALSAEILQTAERLTVDLNLRSLDCIHLACALTCQSRLRRRLLFITADARQLECARNLDLEIVPIK